MNSFSERITQLSEDKRALLERLLSKKGVEVSRSVILPRRGDSKSAPLSFAQQRLWLLDQLEPDSSAYNIALASKMEGPLNVMALERALDEMIRRHESLRTTFTSVDGIPTQVISPHTAFHLTLLDLSSLPAEQRERETQALFTAESERPFTLSSGPLLRLELVKLAEEEHALLLVVHHIISDGWSMSIFTKELATLYHAFAAGRRSPLAELPIQYADYAEWQRNWLSGERLSEQLAYWKEQLADAPPLLELPTDSPRPAVQRFRGASVSMQLSAELTTQLKQVCRAQALTPFMALLGAFALLLSRHSRQSDIMIGTPVAGRTRLETENLIGFFVNTLVLRVRTEPRQSVREMWAAVKEATLQAHASQDVPFEKLVEELEPERSLSYSPLFQVMFAMQNTVHQEATQLGEVKVTALQGDSETAKFDLTIEIEESGDTIQGKLSYNRDLFSAESMARLAAQYERLVAQMVRDSEQPASRITLLSEAEREQIVRNWNDETRRDYEPSASLAELIEAQAAHTPTAVALIEGGRELSYQELNERANRLAHYLQKQGVGPEVLVGVLLERSVEMVVSLLAVLKAGGAYVPLDPAYPSQRLALMLADSAPLVLLTQASLREAVPAEVAAQIKCVDTEWEEIAASESTENPERTVRAGNLAYVIYTSGSTGRPKGVAITHQSAITLLHWAQECFSAAELRGVLFSTSICFDLSIFEMFVPLSCGGCVVLVENALQLAGLAEREQVTLINTVPSAMAELVRGGWVPASVTTVNLAGEALSRELVTAVYGSSGVQRLWNLYGPTEDTTYSTAALMEASEQERPLIGRPIANTESYILDAYLEPVPVGVAGELYIGGEGLARGYLQRPELTAEKFVPHPFSDEGGERLYRTGDLVRYRANGELEYLGRIDHQVKVRGYRIELGEIEAALRQQTGIQEAVVVVREDGTEKRLIGYVVGEEPQAISLVELKRSLATQLPEYMVPSVIVVLEQMPLTPNGKVDRKALPAPQFTRSELESPYVAPRTPSEELVAAIWAEVLKVEEVGVYDNFFALGGHSLLATQVISRVRSALAVELALRSLFEQPTVAGLTALIEQARANGEGEEQRIEVVSRDGELLLSYAQQRLWFLDQLKPDSSAYNLPAAVRFTGQLNVRALEQSLDEIIRRHESLRTTFIPVDGVPTQVISPHSVFHLPLLDLSDLPVEKREREARALFTAEAERSFTLSIGPLLRLQLVKLAEEDHALLLVMHHIISDGWSMNVFGKELVTLYDAFAADRPSPLAELPIQYADYAQWQRNWLAGERLSEQLAYWKEQLADAPPLLELPTDFPRPAVQTFGGAAVPIEFSAELTTQLKQVCRAQAMTPFMALLSAYALLLSRHSRQSDIMIGTPVAGRTRLETESLIGFFVNTLVLRTRIQPEQSVRELWAAVKEVTLQAHGHQDVPFEKLVEELEPERSLSYTPLFQVMFSLQNTPREAVQLAGLKLEGMGTDAETAKFDLTLGLEESGGQFCGSLVYNRDLFSAESMTRLAAQYERLVAQMVHDSERQVSGLQLLSEGERDQLIVGWNETAEDYEKSQSLAELIEEQAARTPTAVALSHGGRELSYQELNERANQLAHYLQRQGVGSEVLVGVLLERSVEMVVSLLAVLKAGGAYIPLDPAYPSQRLALMLTDSAPLVLLTQASLREAVPAEVAALIKCVDTQWEEIAASESTENLEPSVRTGNLAYVIYTSGSTGRPKGVAITHGSLLNLVHWAHQRCYGQPGERTTHIAGLSFDASVLEVWPTLSSGACLYLPDETTRLNPEQLLAWLVEQQINSSFVPTPVAEVLLRAEWPEGSALQRLLTGGDRLHEYRRPGQTFEVINNYGPTEATVVATVETVGEAGENGELPSIGRPIANTDVYVLDEAQQVVPVGVAGELYIGGEGLARGYLGRPELTAEKFVPHPFGDEGGERLYRTGDLVRYRTGGDLEYLGRIDQQVKIRGYRIELGEIESVLRQEAGIREAVVVVTEERAAKRLIGYVVGEEPQAISVVELKRSLGTQLPEYMVPSVIVVLAELPLTPNGKVDRKALPAPQFTRSELESPYVAPRTPSEELVAAIWAEVLKVEEVGVYDNFFALGGHSLLATQVISRVRVGFGIELPLRHLFEQPTVAGMATVIEQQRNVGGEEQKAITRVSRDGELQLSYAQQRLWFLDQLEPESTAYNIPAAARLSGALNVRALEQALDEIIRRHESLRTSFASVDGQPVQVIAPPSRFNLPITDLSDLAADEQRSTAKVLLQQEATAPFDLASGPLFRASLLRMSETEHALLIVMHHIISDGWSMNVFSKELVTLYDAFAADRPSPLAELPIQYADYAQWQRNWLAGERLTEQLAYWKEQLSGAPPLLELPTDYPRPAVQRFRGASVSFELSTELTTQLKQVCRAQAMTPFMALLSAYALLLSRHSRQSDILIGTPIAGRTRLETESLIGFFVNTLVLRVQTDPRQSVRELWAAVKEVTLQAHGHQDVPFEKLVEELEPERSLSYSPLFQVMFSLQNTPREAVQLVGLKLEGMATEGETAKFDLTLALEESDGQFRGSLIYNRDLFSAESMARLTAQYERLVAQMVRDSEQPVNRITLLSETEREQIVRSWNDETRRDYESSASLADLIEEQAARTPAAVALVQDRELSYQELNERANRLAHYLQQQGVGSEVLVGVLLERSIEMVVSLLAVLKAGGAYVPLDPAYPHSRLALMLTDSEPRVLLTQASLREAVPAEVAAQIICVDTDSPLWAEHKITNPHTAVQPETTAYVIYTSGSTGRPKGVLVPHRAICNHLLWRQAAYPLSTADRFLQKASFSFDISVWEIFGTLLSGARLILARHRGEQDPAYLVELMAAEQVSVAHFGPALLQAIVDEPGITACHSLKRVFCGGESLSNQLAEQFFSRLSAELHHQYGPTETTVDVTIWDCARDGDARVIPIGRPIANTVVYVLDEAQQVVPVGVAGELYVGGASVARGYLGRADVTAEKFVPHPFSEEGERLYRTGDLVRYRANGELEYLGRIDQQVKLRGYRIELGEIEAVLRQQVGVREAVAIVREDGADKRLIAYVVGEAGASANELSVADLKRSLGTQLPEYMVPSVIVVLAELPLTPNGKVDRKALPAPQFTRSELESPYVAPRTPSEELVAAIWAEVLKVEEVGVYDNFFALGGHSLLATQVISRVRAALAVELPLRSLFEQPTVAGMATVIEHQRSVGGEEQTAIARVSRDGELQLSYAQQRLWFLDQLEPDSSTYNIPAAVRFTGHLNVRALERALDEIIDRHESLRTSFVSEDGRPIQAISPHTVFHLPLLDLSSLPAEQRERELRALFTAEAERPFTLSSGSLLRLRLVKLAEEEHALLLVMHHIISDGWSMNVFGRELTQLYQAFSHAQASPLTELPIQYADYAQWQRNWLAGERLSEQLAYWKEQLSGAPPLLELPTDYPRPAVQRNRGASVSLELSAELTTELKRVCRKEGMTPFMALLSAYALLLSRHSRQSDIMIGTPVAGRTRLETESLIGFFVNTLVLRVQTDPQQSVSELWAAVKEVTLQAHGHQDVPFEKLVEELEPERSLSYSPLFQVMFSMQNTPREAVQLAGLKLEGMGTEGETAKFDLTLALEESGGQLRGSLVYNRDLFSADSMARLAAQYERLVAQMVRDSEQPVNRLTLLSATEREQLIVGWNETAKDYDQSANLAELIEAQAARTPTAVALIQDGCELSYQELNERANQLAHYLLEQGVGPEVLVGVLLERSIEMVVSLLAVLKAGGAYVPLDPAYPSPRLALMLTDSAPLVLLTQASLREAVPAEVTAQIICVDTDSPLWAEHKITNPHAAVQPETTAYVIYTSGSTGRPKGVLVPHRAICNHLLWRQAAYPLSTADRFLQKASFSFDISVWEIFGTLLSGAKLILARHRGEQDPAYLVELMATEQVSVAHFGPALLQAIVEEPGITACHSLKRVFCGGESLSNQLAEQFFSRLSAELHHQYGPTETTVDVTIWDCARDGDARVIPIGRPIANTVVYVLDEAQQVVPVGVAGELYVGGVSVARGYLGRADVTAEKFVPHPFSDEGERLYRTGDLVRYRESGELEYLGRIDQQVKLRGYRIELGEIEAVLRQQAGVREAVVVVREQDADKRLIAYVVGADAAGASANELSVAELKRNLGTQLPEYMVPSVIVVLAALPLTPNGKVDRKALPAPQFTRSELESPYVAPRTPSEELVAAIWAEVLKVEEVGVYDNFFALGGHSLLATQVISRVRAALSVELALRSLFEQPTVAGLTALIEQARANGEGEEQRIEVVSRDGELLLSYAQQRLWFLDQLEPDSSVYNIPTSVKLLGQLDFFALERSLAEIVRRHESLRTSFASVDGQPTQVISAYAPFALPVTDFSHLREDEQHSSCRVLLQEQATASFDLASGPLFRVRLIKLSADEHVLALVMHHIISDGWSMNVFGRELTQLYQAFSQAESSPLTELPIQYADYAQWQRNWLSGERLTEQLGYWKEQLADAPPLLELPTDYPRPAVQRFRGASVPLELSAELTTQLKQVCRAQAMTPFMALLSAYALLLSRYSRQSDIMIGTPVAGRTRLETESLIGFFVNTLVLRTRIQPEQSVRELWAAVKEVTLQAHGHQDVPFEKLVEELEPERSLSYSPLFQVMFSLQNTPREAVQLAGLKLEGVGTEGETAKFDLTLGLEETGGQLRGSLVYNRDLFSAESMMRLAAQYERLVAQMVRDSEQPASRITLLSETEREQIVRSWNDETRRDYEPSASLAELIEAQAARTPTAVALVEGGRELSYQELNQRANRLAHYLQKQGVGPEVLVGVLLERSVEMVVSLLAVLKAGGAYVPLDPAYPSQRLALMLSDSEPLVLLTQASLCKAVPAEIAAHIKCVDTQWEEIAATESTENPEREVRAGNLAYVIYTSGSTGRPKGVAITHQSAITLLHWAQECFSAAELRGVLFSTSICFDLSIFEMFVPLSCGGCVVLVENALQLAGLAEREQVTLINTVPSAMAELVRGGWVPASVTTVNLAGEALSRELVTAVYGSSGVQRIWNLYGPSEDTTYSTAALMEASEQERPLIGRPIANTESYILDAYLEPVPVGVAGELYIGGEGLARGYLQRPELTAEKFVPHPFSDAGERLYRTGDLVRYRANGELEYLGRIDHQVKVRGYRIELGEIEAALRQQTGIQEAVVVVREDGTEKRLIGYVVGEEQQAISVVELKRSLGTQLPEYMVPSVIVVLEQMPLTPNGKVDRKALPAPQFTRSELESPYVAPRTPSEELVAAIWAEVLKVEEVGVYDNFFALGGHSLLATQVISRVRSALSVELALRSLFEQPTVAGLTALIEQARANGEGEEQRIEVVSRDGALQLSYAQQRLWFLDQLKPDSAAYNIPAAARLSGALDVSALERALDEIIRRHESLRTSFVSVDGQPVQVIVPPSRFTLPITDLSDLAADEQRSTAKMLLQQEATASFDLASGPLFRASLLRMSETEHALLVVMHHIISDGWSMNVFGRELTQLYQAFSQAQPSPLAELPIQYADYAQWQRNWLSGERLAEQLAYWKEQLSGAPPLLELPTDYSRPAVQSFRGASVSLALSVELTTQLKQVCRAQAMTPFMALLSAYALLLSRHCRQSDIMIGTPVAGRTRLETESLIGFFVNTLVLRTRIQPEQSVRELWAAVKEVTLQAHGHQDVPFEKLVEELEPERSLSYSPLFQVMFSLQNTPREAVQLAGLKLEGMGTEGETAKFDLTLGLEESGGQFRGSLVYNRDLFSAESMARLAAQYERLVAQMVHDSEQPVSRITLVGETEREQIVSGWNQTQRDYERNASLAELIEEQAARTPTAVALSQGGRELSYQELNERANQLANYLLRQGVGAEVLVGVLLERSVEMVVSLLAVLKAGGAYIPLDPAYPSQRLALMLTDSEPLVLLTQASLCKAVPAEIAAHIKCVDTEWEEIAASASSENPERTVRAENLAYVIYTSGSTGKPKGVAITHGSLLNLVHWTQQRCYPEALKRTTHLAGLSFDASAWEVWPALATGACLYLPDEETRLDPMQLLNWLVDEQISSSFVPTPVAEVLLRAEWPENSALQRLLTGGDRLHEYRRVGQTFELINNYGPTESTVVATAGTVGESGAAGELPSIGRPIANTSVYVLDEVQQVVPVGVPGELYIGGAGLARGYLQRPELTAERFVPHPFSETGGERLYRTGDLVRYRANGELEYLGRIDQQVKLRGYRIELGEIEAVLRQQTGIQEAVVVVREEGAEKRLIAYVVGAELQAINITELKQSLGEQLPEYMVPSAVVQLDQLPLTPNGKVDHKALPAPQFSRSDLTYQYTAPRDAVEFKLAQIWEDALDLRPIGIKDNFFTLGGHSLLAVRLLANVEKEFGRKLQLTILFNGGTIEHMASVLRKEVALAHAASLVTIQPSGERNPFFFIHPVGGHVFCYVSLAHHLGHEQPFYGLQLETTEDGRPVHTDIESMASHYLDELRAVQPEGPYFLGGWSMGGVVALEVAQQLQALGQEVKLLALVDSTIPNFHNGNGNGNGHGMAKKLIASLRRKKSVKSKEEAALLTSFARDMNISFDQFHVSTDELEKLTPEEQLGYVMNKGREAGVVPEDVELPVIERLYELFKNNHRALRSYVPNRYHGQAALFKTEERLFADEHDPMLGWGKVIPALELHSVPGNHYTIVREPHVKVLAERLRDYCHKLEKE